MTCDDDGHRYAPSGPSPYAGVSYWRCWLCRDRTLGPYPERKGKR